MSDIPLDELGARIGADASEAERIARLAGWQVGSDWAGRPTVSTEAASDLVRRHDEEIREQQSHSFNQWFRSGASGRAREFDLGDGSGSDVADALREASGAKPLKEEER